jgi:hypothetical protein
MLLELYCTDPKPFYLRGAKIKVSIHIPLPLRSSGFSRFGSYWILLLFEKPNRRLALFKKECLRVPFQVHRSVYLCVCERAMDLERIP